MKKGPTIFICLLAAVLIGCVPSLNPLYTAKDIVYDPALVGTWIENKESKESWTFAGVNNSRYRLTVRNGEKSSPFIVHMVKIGEHRFLDIVADPAGLNDLKREDLFKGSLIPGHMFMKIHQIEPELKASFLSPDWLEKLLEENPNAIAHVKLEEGRLVLTATTEALQKFMAKYATDEHAFELSGHGLRRKRN